MCISELYSKHPVTHLPPQLASFHVLTKPIPIFKSLVSFESVGAKNMLHSSSKFLSLDANILVATREQDLLYKGLVLPHDVAHQTMFPDSHQKALSSFG